MKQIGLSLVGLSLVLLASTSMLYAQTSTNEELLKRIEVLEKQAAMQRSNLKHGSEWDYLKIGADYRFSVDSLKYKMASGNTAKNNALLSNRLWLNFKYVPDKHIKFNAKLAFNKVFGQPNFNNPPQYDQFDWFGSTTNTDNQLRVKEAFIDYKDTTLFGTNIPWNFGIGRRPTSYNKLISLRDDEAASSPLGHIVSAEFDGGHLGFDFSKITGISGTSIKLAMGRGMSNIQPAISPTPEADLGNNINMYDMNIVPYADKNLHIEMQILKATNLVDITNAGFDQTGTFNPTNYNPALQTVGDIYLGSAMALYNVESLGNTKIFASFATSKTDPKAGQSMLGSTKSEVGTSIWLGTQIPSLFTKGGHWGIEYNHGSKYFRPFTYAEDTVVGSKIATRGNAYEVYFTEQLAKGLTFQARATYLTYDYTGSNGFFGSQTGTPMKISDISSFMKNSDLANATVEKATDIRFYLRYRF